MSGLQNISDITTTRTPAPPVDASLLNRTIMTSCIMFSAGVLGNVLALTLMAISSPEKKRTTFYKLMAGLAFTDLVGTCATSPVVISVHVSGNKLETEMPLCHYFSFMMIFAGFATMSLVCAMAVERYICICHPYAYHCKLSKSYAKYAFIISWLLSIMIAVLPLIGLGQNVSQFPKTWCFFNSTSTAPQDVAFNFIYAIISLIAILVTLGCNFAAIFTVLALRRRQSALSASLGSGAKKARSVAQRYAELQMVVMLVGVTVIFSSCFGPLMVFTIVCQTSLTKNIDVNGWYLTMIRFASFNPILDPWVYLLVRRELRWKIICVLKLILGIRNKAAPPAVQQAGDSPLPRPQPQTHDPEMSCLKFCFHCICDPPIQKTSMSLAGASTSRAGQSNRSPSYIRRIASADSVINGCTKSCVIVQPSPSDNVLLHKLSPFNSGIRTYGLNDSPFSSV